MDRIAVEYSQSQKCYHIETVQDMLDKNRAAMLAGHSTTYEPLEIVETYEKADQFIREIKKKAADPNR